MDEKFSTAIKLVARNIRARRAMLGISQDTFALKIGVDRTYFSKIERGLGNPSLKVLCAIAAALEWSVADLFGHHEISAPSSDASEKKKSKA